MQYQSSAIHVDPDDPRVLGGEIITQEEAVEMFGSDLGYPNTYAEDEIPSDEEVEKMIEAQIEEGSAWAIKSAKAR